MFPVLSSPQHTRSCWIGLILAILCLSQFSEALAKVRVSPEVALGVSFIPSSGTARYQNIGFSGGVGLSTRVWKPLDLLLQFDLRRHPRRDDRDYFGEYSSSSVTGDGVTSYDATGGLRLHLGQYQFAQVGVGTTQTDYEDYIIHYGNGNSEKVRRGTTPGHFVIQWALGFNIQSTKWGTIVLLASVIRESSDYDPLTAYALRTGFRFD